VTDSHAHAYAAIDATGVVAILRGGDPASLEPTLDALIAGGVRAIEISLTTTNAFDRIARAVKHAGGRASIGAGTVLDRVEVERVADLGATFIVSPILDAQVIDASLAGGLLPLPGVYTPTEAVTATRFGAPAVKLFPADSVGPAFVRALLAPLPALKIVPTGGVTLDLAREFATAGAWAIGVGGPLIGAGIGPPLEARARAFVAAMRPESPATRPASTELRPVRAELRSAPAEQRPARAEMRSASAAQRPESRS
jgi:2-dehydro-3-deoxyphosphogluconate aldolase / (4S)-4-hydroxy-2-oxoglutarate aldolase